MRAVAWLIVIVIVILALILRSQGWHFVHKPTPEQLYGCPFAVADQHNGECP